MLMLCGQRPPSQFSPTCRDEKQGAKPGALPDEVAMVPLFPEAPASFHQRQALINAANAGDGDAQATLGDVLRSGDGFTDQDFEAAIRWYRLAAHQGHA